ncbi:hypothetical protein AC1031_012526 [Aphanomyces cochlioides]|nr:hypothetical protein AC1031_012526 [Aphanomyces cochlioides]
MLHGPLRIIARPARPLLCSSISAVSMSSTSPASPPTTTNESWAQKGKRFLQVYGTVGVVTHTTLSLASYSILYLSISRGLDVGSFLGSWMTSIQAAVQANMTQDSENVETASNAMVAYAVYKLLAPVRWPLTFFVTPIVVRQWNKIRPPQSPKKDPKSVV